ncbi:DUF420 domain-containing protein [Litoribacter alkaliphilus]|uniref:DUF420 domain-containing protein n=1 Tax=Litoribacter ruber TaxID=702568 RepID=A0AAP2CF00_9BACT|nr:DUF420 domain-containing protein [Litoribacter alkaliphilus]MBS9522647.1 DUF420 domain-containing protein [Litoribacter alkaliphilus]
MEANNITSPAGEKKVYGWIVAISIAVPIVVAILLFMPAKLDLAQDWVYFLPHLNAVINSAATVALLVGLYFIRQNNIPAHKASMTTAFGLGAVFLVSYVVYHASAPSTTFGGEGVIRTIYYVILITHILLAAIALFPILLAYYFGMAGNYVRHKKVVRYAYPIWLYVTISGVVVYLMISPYYGG